MSDFRRPAPYTQGCTTRPGNPLCHLGYTSPPIFHTKALRDNTLSRATSKIEWDAIYYWRGPREILQLTRVSRLPNRGHDGDSTLIIPTIDIFSRHPQFVERRLRELINVTIGYIPNVGNQRGATGFIRYPSESEVENTLLPSGRHVVVRSSNTVKISHILHRARRAPPEHGSSTTRQVSDLV